jgi:hypothetical protein
MPPPSSIGDKRIKICYKDDGDSGKIVAAPEAPGTRVSTNVLPSPSPD